MTHPLEAIVALQKKDLRLIRLIREVQDIPKRKDDIEHQVNGFKRKLEETSEQRKKMEVKIKKVTKNGKKPSFDTLILLLSICIFEFGLVFPNINEPCLNLPLNSKEKDWLMLKLNMIIILKRYFTFDHPKNIFMTNFR